LIKGNFAALTGLKKTLATKAVASKLYYLHQDGSTHHFLWDTLLFKKTKALFGGRCRMMVTGSAPVAQDVLDFFKVVACCPILEGYGQTETMYFFLI
jgi:long-chain acyl-CoA synthetase